MTRVVAAALACALFVLAARALAAPGDLDPGFGTSGVVTTAAPASQSSVLALVRQPDGKLVTASTPGVGQTGVKLARYDSDGSRDTSFGTGGVVSAAGGVAGIDAAELSVLPDGRIVLAAGGGVPGGPAFVARFLPDGAPDATFGSAGIAAMGAGLFELRALLVQTDGKPIVVGMGAQSGGTALVRLTPSGAPDPSFGTGGVAEAPNPSSTTSGAPGAALLEADGSVLVGAVAANHFVLVRFRPDGAVDAAFGNGGVAVLGPLPDAGAGYVTDIAPLADGRLAVAATASEFQPPLATEPLIISSERVNFVLFAVRPDGTLDTSFGNGGRIDTPIGGFLGFHLVDPWLGATTALAVQPDGRIVQAGRAAAPGGAPFTFALVRYRADGSIDHSFGNAGVVTLPAGTQARHAVALQPDGKLVLGGGTSLVRYLLIDPAAGNVAIEYRHAAFDHYFITSLPGEIAALNAGTVAGWQRTGQYFRVYPVVAPPVVSFCRFFSGQAFAPKSSHFYTPFAFECDIVRHSPDWLYEGNVMGVRLPSDAGDCPAGTQPLYRLYNDGHGGAPNHRYTTRLDLRAAMIGQGWIPEGAGSIGVIACVPG
jgi:uncharacterized delta-60 repeat protein